MSRLGERGTPRLTADQVVRTSPARQSLTPNRPRLRRLSDELGLMALGLAARAKRLCLNLFNDTRACGTVQRYTRLRHGSTIHAPAGDSDEAEHDSGGKSNRIPVRSRTAIGAKRRWYFNCGISVRLGQRAEPSEHPPERSGGRDAQAGKGFGERGAASFPGQRVATPAELYPAGSTPPFCFLIESPRISIR